MRSILLRRYFALTLGALVVAGTTEAKAAFPERPVHFLVALSPGGGVDTIARIVAQKLSEKWGQPVLVENRPGGDGTLAADTVARAAPDGYTIGLVNVAFTATPSLSKLNYDPIKSFAPVTQLTSPPGVLVVKSSFPAKTAKDLVEMAKAKPGALNFGDTGIGSGPFLETEIFMNQTGAKMTHVAYKGGGDVVVALMGGEIQVYFATMPSVLEQIKSGVLRALAVTTSTRVAALPDVPTVAEAVGLKRFEAVNTDWSGVLAPAGTPPDIVNKIQRDIVDVMKEPDTAKRVTDLGYLTIASTPDDFAKEIAVEIKKWEPLLKPYVTKK